MKLLNISKDFEEFVKASNKEEEEVISNYYNDREISDKGIEKLNNLYKEVKLIVFSELYCKDAAIALPILNELSKLNKFIYVEYIKRKENETLIEKLSGEKRVPTIIKVDEHMNIIGKYIEFPETIKAEIHKNKEVKDSFRAGNFNEIVQDELINLIIK